VGVRSFHFVDRKLGQSVSKPLKVLFLCSGNTCRSPLAEALARRRERDGRVVFASAGLQAEPGEPASEGSLLVAAELGLDLSGHRARRITADLLGEVAWVVAMTRAQVALFRRACPGYRGRVGLLGLPGIDLVAGPAVAAGDEVRDPMGGDLAAYHAMADQVDRLVGAWQEVFTAGVGPGRETP
jgi:protein-tyrosine-phosphatase